MSYVKIKKRKHKIRLRDVRKCPSYDITLIRFSIQKTSFLIKTKCKILVNLTVEFFILACKCYTIILFEIFNERKDDVMVKTH